MTKTEDQQLPLQRKIFLGEAREPTKEEMDAAKIGADDGALVTATVSTDEVDRYNEVIEPGSFRKHLKKFKRNPVILYAHQYGSRYKVFPIGKAEKIEIVDHGLKMLIRFATEIAEHEDARIVAGLMKGGYLNAFSVGFIPIKWISGNTDNKEPNRTYTEVELLEVSVVPVPAASGAVVDGRAFDEAVEDGILPTERLEEFRPVRDAEDLVRVLQRESLLPDESDKYVWVPLLRGSEYDHATTRAFLYSTEDKIECQVAKRVSDGEEVPVKFRFDKMKRWDRDKAQKWVESLGDEEWSVILENLPITKDMDVMAGRDLFQAIEYDRARRTIEEVEDEAEIINTLERIEIEPEIKGAIPYRKEPLADEGTAWDAGKARRQADTVEKRRRISAWVESGAEDNLTVYKYPHHYVDPGPYQTVWRGCAAGMARLMQNPQQPDRAGIHRHLAGHYRDFDMEVPRLKEAPYESVKEVLNEVEAGDLERDTAGYILSELISDKGVAELTRYVDQVVTAEREAFRRQTYGYLKALTRIGDTVGIDVDDVEEKVDLIVKSVIRLSERKEDEGIEATEVVGVLRDDSQRIRVDDLGALEKVLTNWLDRTLDRTVEEKINRARGLIEFPKE